MKTKKEWNAEGGALHENIAELSEDELQEVVGGIADEDTARRDFIDAYYALCAVLSDKCSNQVCIIVKKMSDECMDAYTRPGKTVLETVNDLKMLQIEFIDARTTLHDTMISSKIRDILEELYSKLGV